MGWSVHGVYQCKNFILTTFISITPFKIEKWKRCIELLLFIHLYSSPISIVYTIEQGRTSPMYRIIVLFTNDCLVYNCPNPGIRKLAKAASHVQGGFFSFFEDLGKACFNSTFWQISDSMSIFSPHLLPKFVSI